MKNNMSREKVILLCMIIAILVLVGVITVQQVKIEKFEEPQVIAAPTQETIKGEFTLFQYAASWINPIYIEGYRLDGQVLYYTEKYNTQELPISIDNLRIVPSWIEGNELMKYGFWIPDDLGL